MNGNPFKMQGGKPLYLKRRPLEDPQTPLESIPPFKITNSLNFMKKLMKKPNGGIRVRFSGKAARAARAAQGGQGERGAARGGALRPGPPNTL